MYMRLWSAWQGRRREIGAEEQYWHEIKQLQTGREKWRRVARRFLAVGGNSLPNSMAWARGLGQPRERIAWEVGFQREWHVGAQLPQGVPGDSSFACNHPVASERLPTTIGTVTKRCFPVGALLASGVFFICLLAFF